MLLKINSYNMNKSKINVATGTKCTAHGNNVYT